MSRKLFLKPSAQFAFFVKMVSIAGYRGLNVYDRSHLHATGLFSMLVLSIYFHQKPNWNQFVPVMIEQAKTINSTSKITPQPQPVHEQPRPKPKVSCSQSNSQVNIISFKNPARQPDLPSTIFSLFYGILNKCQAGFTVYPCLLLKEVYVGIKWKLHARKRFRLPEPAVSFLGVKRRRRPACPAPARVGSIHIR